MSKGPEGFSGVKHVSLLTLLALAGCTKAIQGEAGAGDVLKNVVSEVRSTEATATPTSMITTISLTPTMTPSSKPPKGCAWSTSKPQPFETTNPQVGINLTPECTLKPTDPIKIYEQPDDSSTVIATFSPRGELAVGVHCIAEGTEVEGVNGPSSSWLKAEAVADKKVQVGYFAGPVVGYAMPAPKVEHC